MRWYTRRFAVRAGAAALQRQRRCCFHAGINAQDYVVARGAVGLFPTLCLVKGV
jgi:hypothetical protein